MSQLEKSELSEKDENSFEEVSESDISDLEQSHGGDGIRNRMSQLIDSDDLDDDRESEGIVDDDESGSFESGLERTWSESLVTRKSNKKECGEDDEQLDLSQDEDEFTNSDSYSVDSSDGYSSDFEGKTQI